jgi:hypothetical protein
MRNVKEYYVVPDDGLHDSRIDADCIGADDITPGMLRRLRAHAIPAYEHSRIVVRDRVSREKIEVIAPRD